ncbi:hypothetical protein D1871_23525 [Nakamurella silvestris]|nr:hypothetical protein D1871_23525 [Nakamurella silvestris]
MVSASTPLGRWWQLPGSVMRVAVAVALVLTLSGGLGAGTAGAAGAVSEIPAEPEPTTVDDPGPSVGVTAHFRRHCRAVEGTGNSAHPPPPDLVGTVAPLVPHHGSAAGGIPGNHLPDGPPLTLRALPSAVAVTGPIILLASAASVFWHRRRADDRRPTWPTGTGSRRAVRGQLSPTRRDRIAPHRSCCPGVTPPDRGTPARAPGWAHRSSVREGVML